MATEARRTAMVLAVSLAVTAALCCGAAHADALPPRGACSGHVDGLLFLPERGAFATAACTPSLGHDCASPDYRHGGVDYYVLPGSNTDKVPCDREGNEVHNDDGPGGSVDETDITGDIAWATVSVGDYVDQFDSNNHGDYTLSDGSGDSLDSAVFDGTQQDYFGDTTDDEPRWFQTDGADTTSAGVADFTSGGDTTNAFSLVDYVWDSTDDFGDTGGTDYGSTADTFNDMGDLSVSDYTDVASSWVTDGLDTASGGSADAGFINDNTHADEPA